MTFLSESSINAGVTDKLKFDTGQSEDSFNVILERNVFNAQKNELELLDEPQQDLVLKKTETVVPLLFLCKKINFIQNIENVLHMQFLSNNMNF